MLLCFSLKKIEIVMFHPNDNSGLIMHIEEYDITWLVKNNHVV